MTASLEALPVELVERVVTSLETGEAGVLRLVCRELRDKASQGVYLNLFTNRSIDVTGDGLAALTKALSQEGLARQLRNLTLVAVVYNPRTERMRSPALSSDCWSPASQSMLHREDCPSKFKLATADRRFAARREVAELRLQQAKHQFNVETGAYFGLLASTFESLKANCAKAGLDSLVLTVAVQTSKKLRFSPDAMELRYAATEESQLLAVAMHAITSTHLPIKHFDIFSKTRLCSIASTELAAWLNNVPASTLRSFGRQLSSLSISYCRVMSLASASSSCCNCRGRRFRATDAAQICHNHSCKFKDDDDEDCEYETSVASFTSIFPNLTSLDLHEYQTEWVSEEADSHTLVSEYISQRIHLPHLQTLTLRGATILQESLLRLLMNLPVVEHLVLTHVNLVDGIWTPILDYIKDKSKVQHLELMDLFEGKHGVPLNGPSAGLGGGGNANPFGNPHHIPPPPPPALPPIFGNAPHSYGSYSSMPTQTETYVNSLLSFRAASVPKSECYIGGCFGTNRVVLKGMWVAKAVLTYTNFTHSSLKAKIEGRWDRERIREYGPTSDAPNIMDY